VNVSTLDYCCFQMARMHKAREEGWNHLFGSGEADIPVCILCSLLILNHFHIAQLAYKVSYIILAKSDFKSLL